MKFLVFAKYRARANVPESSDLLQDEFLSTYPLQRWTGYEVHLLSDFKQVFDLAIKAFGG